MFPGKTKTRQLVQLLRARRGATSVEYALVAAMVSIIAIPIILSIGDTLNRMFFQTLANSV